MKRKVEAVVLGALLMASVAVGATEIVGQEKARSRLIVLGTRHLSSVEDLTPSHLDGVIEALVAQNPAAVLVEALDGASIQGMMTQPFLHAEAAGAYMNYYRETGRHAQATLNIEWGSAREWVLDGAEGCGVPDTQRDCILKYAAAYEYHSALLQYRRSSDEVKQALDELPEEFRLPLLLSSLGGLQYKEISAALNIPIGTVMSRLFRARQRLRRGLRSYAAERGIRVGTEEELLRASDRSEEGQHVILVGSRPRLVENVPDQRHIGFDSESTGDLVHGHDMAVTGSLQASGIVPKIQHGIDPPRENLLVEQGRGGKDLVNVFVSVETFRPLGEGAEQQPALVQRSAGDADRLALEVLEKPNG